MIDILTYLYNLTSNLEVFNQSFLIINRNFLTMTSRYKYKSRYPSRTPLGVSLTLIHDHVRNFYSRLNTGQAYLVRITCPKGFFNQFVIYFLALQVNTSQECPDSWKEHGNSCYLLLTPPLTIDPMSWGDSRANCKRHGADLVSILDSSEVDFIHRQTSSLGEFKFWIGLYKNRSTSDPKEGWVWSDGSNFTNPQQWLPGEPNNYRNTSENCAELHSEKKQWNDNKCSALFYWICKRKKGNLCSLFHGDKVILKNRI